MKYTFLQVATSVAVVALCAAAYFGGPTHFGHGLQLSHVLYLGH